MARASQMLVAWVVLGALAGAVFCAEKSSASHEAMMALSASMRELVDGLDRRDLGAARLHTRSLERAVTALSVVRPQVNAELNEEFDGLRSRLAGLAAEISRAASDGSLVRARAILPDLRQTCTSCHIKFRAENGQRGLYPAVKNTIRGQVHITKLGDREREDASGVVVFLDGSIGNAQYPPPRARPVVSQRNREFSPRVLPLLKGVTVEFPNDDTIFHNVFSLAKARPFDLGIYKSGRSKSVTFDKPGLVAVHCNIHPNMVAHLLVLNNPYFAVTDRKGLFVLTGVPDGSYQLRTWHKSGGEVRRRISVAGGALYREDFEIQEDRKSVQHRDKHGKPYRKKYG